MYYLDIQRYREYYSMYYMHRFIVYIDWYSCGFSSTGMVPRFRKLKMAEHHMNNAFKT